MTAPTGLELDAQQHGLHIDPPEVPKFTAEIPKPEGQSLTQNTTKPAIKIIIRALSAALLVAVILAVIAAGVAGSLAVKRQHTIHEYALSMHPLVSLVTTA